MHTSLVDSKQRPVPMLVDLPQRASVVDLGSAKGTNIAGPDKTERQVRRYTISVQAAGRLATRPVAESARADNKVRPETVQSTGLAR